MDFLLQCARYISSFHSPQTVVVFSFRNLPEFTFLVSRTQFSQGWWALQVFLQFSKLKEISQTDFYLTHTLLLNSCSCRGQLMRPWIKLNVMFYFFDSLYHTENFIPILMRTNLWETKSHPVNLPDMEKRDGTPFMGLTTQDGIPSVDAKTANKRCKKFHFPPYFTSLHLFHPLLQVHQLPEQDGAVLVQSLLCSKVQRLPSLRRLSGAASGAQKRGATYPQLQESSI